MRQRVAYELRVPETELDSNNALWPLTVWDSLIAVTDGLPYFSQSLGLELEVTLLWDYPNFNLLSSYLIDRCFSQPGWSSR